MNKSLSLFAMLLLLLGVQTATAQGSFRPPAVPLITHDPYFSIWSTTDQLTQDWPKHWTGAHHGMFSAVQVDGKPFRIMGPHPREVEAARQTSLQVRPTETVYTFEAGGIAVELTFTSPLIAGNMDLVSRPVSYLTWNVKSIDGKSHDVSVYYDASAQIAVNTDDQQVNWSRFVVDNMSVMRFGMNDQKVLNRSGDNLRIEWGHLYLTAPPQGNQTDRIASSGAARGAFIQTGKLPANDDMRAPRAVNQGHPVMAVAFDLGNVSAAPVSRHVLLAYDDQYSLEYFQRKLRPYWRRNGMEADELLATAAREYTTLLAQTRAFDEQLTADLRAAGGDDYVKVATVAFRQTLAAHKLVVDFDGTPLYFSKENFSNGCIGTVDLTYPSGPFFLLLNPALLKAQLVPVLDYAKSPRWKWPFAPHDLGQYPLANGQVYGGGERTEENQMPVEESGNMLILIGALAKVEGNADLAREYWPTLQKWAAYLLEKGLDPENQLSTDDFAGHLAHNTNLSIKAIEALGSYASLAEQLGHKQEAKTYRKAAEGMARQWMKMADDGDHYRLAFDKEGTWSQKYNLVWDKLLGLNLFPESVAKKEMAYYKTVQQKYGLPLDNRKTYTKLDWILWTATMADNQADFQHFVGPLVTYLNESPSRVPMSDWFETTNARQVGFQARSVVGGVYIKMLANPEVWQKWAAKAQPAAATAAR